MRGEPVHGPINTTSVVARDRPRSGRGWWAIFHANPGARLRLVCFAYGGGAASVFRLWHCGLRSDVEVCAVQLPGCGRRTAEPPIGDLRTLVPAIAQGLLPALDRPFVFFGHSLGAVLSFEITRWLRRTHGVMPEHLIVSAR